MDNVNSEKLKNIASQMMTPKKGILAADESNGTANKRFASLGIPETEEERRRWRELLFTTPDFEKYVNGVILYDETIRQSTTEGKFFRDYLKEKGVLVGIKVDQGLTHMIGSASVDEHVTMGLDGLPARLQEYKTMGASFAKWRAAFPITEHTPSDEAIKQNCEILTRCAVLCQENDIVPMIEPEVLLDGDHSIEKAEEVTTKVLTKMFEEISKHHVNLEGLILKTSMVLSGKDSANRADSKTVAEATVRTLKNTVPEGLAGVVFLSGGQSPDEAAENFDAIAEHEPLPWPLAFSFSRALQNDAMEIWLGKEVNRTAAQEAFRKRLEMNSKADQGLL